MKHVMRENCRFFEEGRQEHGRGDTSSQPCSVGIKHGLIHSFNIKEIANIPQRELIPTCFLQSINQ